MNLIDLDLLCRKATPANKPYNHSGMCLDMSDADIALWEASRTALPLLIEVAKAMQSLFSEEGAFESVSHFNAAFAVKDALEKLKEAP